MNGKIKVEVWDDDIGANERVGTFYFDFKKLSKHHKRKKKRTGAIPIEDGKKEDGKDDD